MCIRDRLCPEIGFVNGRPAEGTFSAAVDDELNRMNRFLGLD